MKNSEDDLMNDDLRPEYDLTQLRVRRLGLERRRFGGQWVKLAPDVAEIFPDTAAVNEALRFLIRVTRPSAAAVATCAEQSANWKVSRMLVERPLNELTQDAIRILYRELGVMETVRFLRQFSNGYGDYMAEREALLGRKSLDELVEGIKARHSNAPTDY